MISYVVKFDFLFTSREFFTAQQLLTLKAQIRLCFEYGSHLWRGISKHALDAIQKRAIRLRVDPTLTASIGSLIHPKSLYELFLIHMVDTFMA